jgi:cytohesin
MSHVASHHRLYRPRFQFSVRLLLIATAVLAAFFAIGFALYRERVATRRPWLFLQAVKTGDIAEVDRLLKIDPSLAHGREHGNTSFGLTPLQAALAHSGHSKVFDRLLAEHPDLDERSPAGDTALHVAVNRQMPVAVQRLLKLGANPNAANEHGVTPLLIAVQDDRGGMTQLLLQGGADPTQIAKGDASFDGKTPLHVAAERNNHVAIRLMLTASAQVDARDAHGRTALHIAMSRDNYEAAGVLTAYGADLAAKDSQGRIPGQRNDIPNSPTAARIWWEQIEQSLKKGESDKLDETLARAPQVLSFRTGYSPETMLHRAIQLRRLDVLDYLLTRKADPNSRGQQGQTPLHDACWTHMPVDFAKRLIEAGADFEAKDNFGQTPLHAAARGHNHDVLRLLISKGANLDALDNGGTTVLDAAFLQTFFAETGLKTLSILREAAHQPTVLYAAAAGDLELLQKLTGGDGEPLDRAYTRIGVCPLHAAVLGKQPDVIQWLFAKGVDHEPPSPVGWGHTTDDTPLLIALGYNLTDIAILLIENGASVNRKGSSDYYPAHAVIQSGRDPRILAALLAHGADPTLQYQGKSVTQMAVDAKYGDRARYLELLNAAANKSAAGR